MLNLAKRGFSMLELSIVLVIVALVVGGVFVGGDMIDSARNKETISNLTDYRTMYEQFKEKYEGPPGDLSDAESYWGAGNTNNGDGDWNIENELDNATDLEEYLAWEHLNLAGFVNVAYTGVRSLGGTNSPIIGTEIPEGAYPNSGHRMVLYDSDTITGINFTLSNTLILGAFGNPNADSYTHTKGVLSPQDAYSIDLKTDDGLPQKGLFMAQRGHASYITAPCAETQGSENSAYNLDNAAKDCQLIFFLEKPDRE